MNSMNYKCELNPVQELAWTKSFLLMPCNGIYKFIQEQGTVWSPVTDHYVNKVNFFSVNSKCQDCFYVADKGIIYSND